MKTGRVHLPLYETGLPMHRVLNIVDLVGTGAIGLAVYQIAQLGPYEATILLGRCVRVFIAAIQGYV